MLRVPPAPAPQRSIGLVHRGQHRGMLPHAEIVVRAPDRHLGRPVVRDIAHRPREIAAHPLEFGEDPVVALLAERRELLAEQGVVIHDRSLCLHRPTPVTPTLRRSPDSGQKSTFRQLRQYSTGVGHPAITGLFLPCHPDQAAAWKAGSARSIISALAVSEMRKSPGRSKSVPGITKTSRAASASAKRTRVAAGRRAPEVEGALRAGHPVAPLLVSAPSIRSRRAASAAMSIETVLERRHRVLHHRVGEGPAERHLAREERVARAPARSRAGISGESAR